MVPYSLDKKMYYAVQLIVVCLVTTTLDAAQPVAPLADDLRGSTVSQGNVSRPVVIDDSDRSVTAQRPFSTVRHTIHNIASKVNI